ncbi:MAG: amidohydrolase family protein [Chitinophagaceae bacterium]
MKKIFLIATILSIVSFAYAQQKRTTLSQKLPIIDMHLHAMKADAQGPPPFIFCLPRTDLVTWDNSKPYVEEFTKQFGSGNCSLRVVSPTTDQQLMERTLAIMRKNNMYGMLSGSETQKWMSLAPGRFIPGLLFNLNNRTPSVDSFRKLFTNGPYKVLGEVGIQYNGYSPGDSLFDPYLAVAEELDIPMAIHIGTGPVGAPYLQSPKYRARLHSALLIEEALMKHPKLRVYVMHAGWPMVDDMLAVLWTHPQVYVDVGVISFALPRKEFHRYLQRIVEAGFGKRVMFGSDQMVWPEVIDFAIQSIETATFLTQQQKRDIFYNNAARFLRLSKEETDRHHGR